MQKDEIRRKINSHEGNHINFAITDIDGVLRGKSISKKKFLKSLDQHLGFCDVIFGWDAEDKAYENSAVTGWHTGYPDSPISIDLSSYRETPWNEKIPFFLADYSPSDSISKICPRTLLKKVCEKSAKMGFETEYACEFEWYNFLETPHSLAEKSWHNPKPLTPGMFGYSMLRASQHSGYYNALFSQLPAFNVPLEALHTETGDGVYEASIQHTDALEAADRAVLFKTAVKEIAAGHQVLASFMAKWNVLLPGSGGHIHQSLWNSDKSKNLFYDSSAKNKISRMMEQFIAGQLTCLPTILPMFAPTVNSYKRLVEGSWAPTAVSWGLDNRTTAVRVLNADEPSMRVESRIPGADANPYLSIAASLASGLFGIENDMTLDLPVTKGSDYARGSKRPLPKTLKEATELMKSSEIPATLFGEAFVDHFIKTREWEWMEFSKSVTNWEMKRYFEII